MSHSISREDDLLLDTKYQDRKLIIEAHGLSMNGKVCSGWHDDAGFVRELVLMVTNNQDIELTIQKRDSELVEDIGDAPMPIPASAVFGQYTTYQRGGPQGCSYRVCVKNVSDNDLDVIVRCQTHGMY